MMDGIDMVKILVGEGFSDDEYYSMLWSHVDEFYSAVVSYSIINVVRKELDKIIPCVVADQVMRERE